MKTTIAILLATVGLARADVIPIVIDLGPSADHFGVEDLGNFTELNGPIPADRHIEFDVTFKDNQFIRLTDRSMTQGQHRGRAYFDLVAVVDTDVFGLYWFDYTLPPGTLRLDSPLLVHDVHFDLDFPLGYGTEISNLRFYISSNAFWAVGPHVPDGGSTLPMLGLALTGLLMLVKPTK